MPGNVACNCGNTEESNLIDIYWREELVNGLRLTKFILEAQIWALWLSKGGIIASSMRNGNYKVLVRCDMIETYLHYGSTRRPHQENEPYNQIANERREVGSVFKVAMEI